MRVSVTMKSSNAKVGPIPVSTTEEDSCPSSCSLKNTDCYARFGPLGIHWRKVSDGIRGSQWSLFCSTVLKFCKNQLWRHNQAGDLPKCPESSTGTIDRIDVKKCRELSNSSRHTRGWTYTHYNPLDESNASIISEMNSVTGMTVNLSADTLQQADVYYDLGIAPVCVILPKNAPNLGNKTPNGRHIVVCPAQTNDNMTCEKCKLCQIRDRKSIVGFLAHGTASKRLSDKLIANVTKNENIR